MKRKKALLLVANWDSSTRYAWWLMESYWVKLSEAGSAQLRPVYLAYPGISTIAKDIRDANIIVKKQNFKSSNLISVVKQYVFIINHNIGTIYFSDFPSFHWKYLIYRLAGVNVIIVHDHTPGLRSKPGAMKKRLKKLIHRLPGMSADGVIAATDYVRKRNIETGCVPEKRCYSVPNGLPDLHTNKSFDLREIYAIPLDRKIMITTGRANHFKGIRFALEVMEVLINQEMRRDIHYIFCGGGPDLDDFSRIAKALNIDDYVTFTGELEDVLACLHCCDFAIHPSKGEVGYSLSILEYMQAGLPVIVPDNPSVCAASISGINGYIYTENNKQDAVSKVIRMLDDPADIRQMGARAKAMVRSDYSLDATHELLIKTVQSIEEVE